MLRLLRDIIPIANLLLNIFFQADLAIPFKIGYHFVFSIKFTDRKNR